MPCTSSNLGSFSPELIRTLEQVEIDIWQSFHRLAPAFDQPSFLQPMLARLVSRPGWHLYMAFDGDTPAAAAALYVNGDSGYLGPAVMLPAYRGCGAQGAFIIPRRLRRHKPHCIV